MELIKLNEKVYYFDSPSKVFVYKLDEEYVCLIDSGNNKDAGKKILKLLNEHNLKLKYIINTHSHADHIGGNNYLQTNTNCQIYGSKTENSITEKPLLEPTYLYGGYPYKKLENKFLMAESSKTLDIKDLENDFETIELPGHTFDMIGIKTKENIIFIGDALASPSTIEKYHIFFLYDVEGYLNTLDYLSTLDNYLLLGSHIEINGDIKEIIKIKKIKIEEIIRLIQDIVKKPHTFEEILTEVFNHYQLIMDDNQYNLVGSTIKSYLSYLYNKDRITITYLNNKRYFTNCG